MLVKAGKSYLWQFWIRFSILTKLSPPPRLPPKKIYFQNWFWKMLNNWQLAHILKVCHWTIYRCSCVYLQNYKATGNQHYSIHQVFALTLVCQQMSECELDLGPLWLNLWWFMYIKSPLKIINEKLPIFHIMAESLFHAIWTEDPRPVWDKDIPKVQLLTHINDSACTYTISRRNGAVEKHGIKEVSYVATEGACSIHYILCVYWIDIDLNGSSLMFFHTIMSFVIKPWTQSHKYRKDINPLTHLQIHMLI